SQDPELSKLCSGKPEDVVNLFRFLAEEMREVMAQLGFRTINEMAGRAQFLKKREDLPHWNASKIDFSGISHVAANASGQTLYNTEQQDHGMSMMLDWGLVRQAKPAAESTAPVFATFHVKNTDRTISTLLSNEISKI